MKFVRDKSHITDCPIGVHSIRGILLRNAGMSASRMFRINACTLGPRDNVENQKVLVPDQLPDKDATVLKNQANR